MVVKIQKPLAIIAIVGMTMLLAVSTAVPAFAAETSTTATDSNPRIVYEEPDLGENGATDNYITLPDAPEKEGYTFRGWRVNGGSDLYNAGDVVVKDGSEEMHLQPVYEAATGAKADDNGASSTAEEPDLLDEYEDGTNIVLQYGHDNILTLPDAKDKEGYKFYGWSINGSTDLHEAGATVPVKASEKVTLRPVYVSTKETNDFLIKCSIPAVVGFVIGLILGKFGEASDSRALLILAILILSACAVLNIVGLVGYSYIEHQALTEALQQLQCMAP